MNPLDLLVRHDVLMPEGGGAPRMTGWRRSWYWTRLHWRIWIEDLFQRWECDMCDRRIWQPLLSRHSMRHTDAEWAAAGYDKAGTLGESAKQEER